MKGILVRIGADQDYCGWNAPYDPASGRFFYVPIPEPAGAFHPGCERLYDEVVDPLAAFLRECATPTMARRFPIAAKRGQPMHLDPDFEHLTYGDNGAVRGRDVRKLAAGDLLVFYSGLRSLDRAQRDLVYAITGLYVVDEVLSVHEVASERRAENAHTRKATPGDGDIVVRAKHGLSGRCSRCVPIGERHGTNYYVRPDVLAEWGGLGVKNGYLTRSIKPPMLTDAPRFYEWWMRQSVPLVRSNFAA